MAVDFTNKQQRYYYPDKFNFNRIEGVLPEARNMGRPRPMIVTGKQFLGTNALSGGRIRGRGFFGKRFKPLEGRGFFSDLHKQGFKLPSSRVMNAQRILNRPIGIVNLTPEEREERENAKAVLAQEGISTAGRIRMGKGLLKKINRIQGRKNQTMEGGFLGSLLGALFG